MITKESTQRCRPQSRRRPQSTYQTETRRVRGTYCSSAMRARKEREQKRYGSHTRYRAHTRYRSHFLHSSPSNPMISPLKGTCPSREGTLKPPMECFIKFAGRQVGVCRRPQGLGRISLDDEVLSTVSIFKRAVLDIVRRLSMSS
jgi:hypothetical protein